MELPESKITMSYQEANPAASPTFILLHGLRSNATVSKHLGRHLKGIHLVMIDIPGYGQSDPLPSVHSLENLAKAVDEFIGVQGYKNVVLAGHSFGGTVAFATAHHFPEKLDRLVLVTPALKQSSRFMSVAKNYYKFYAKLPESLQRALLTNFIIVRLISRWLLHSKHPAMRNQYMEYAMSSSHQINPRTVAEVAVDMIDSELQQQVAGFAKPTLLIGAEHDTLTPPDSLRQLADQMKNAEYQQMSDVGHLPPIEKPEELSQLILKHLEENK